MRGRGQENALRNFSSCLPVVVQWFERAERALKLARATEIEPFLCVTIWQQPSVSRAGFCSLSALLESIALCPYDLSMCFPPSYFFYALHTLYEIQTLFFFSPDIPDCSTDFVGRVETNLGPVPPSVI